MRTRLNRIIHSLALAATAPLIISTLGRSLGSSCATSTSAPSFYLGGIQVNEPELLADLAEDRGRLCLSGGLAAAMLADKVEDPLDRAHWYRQAVRNYEAADELKTEIPAFQNTVFTEALLRLSGLTGEAEFARRAVERGQLGLARNENDLAAHYNLACAYSLLGELRLGIKHLDACVSGDHQFLARAQVDPVLEKLRASGAYAAFLETQPPAISPAPAEKPASR